MAIKVVFPIGTTKVTAGGLFQWDYGQILEIESAELGSEIVEIHFACKNMSEAIVRPCAFTDGVGTVAIPDQCLEQAGNISVWIYKIEGNSGETLKTISLNINARKRPAKTHDVPLEYINKYAELVTEMNEAVDAIENGEVTAANAVHATNADNATKANEANYASKAAKADSATNATNADYATSAGSAKTATSATTANKVKEVLNLAATATVTSGRFSLPSEIESGEIYLVVLVASAAAHSGVFCLNTAKTTSYGPVGQYLLTARPGDGEYGFDSYDGSGVGDRCTGTVYFYELGGA